MADSPAILLGVTPVEIPLAPQNPQVTLAPSGQQGPKGDTGDTGPQGEQGIQGETGATGDLPAINTLTEKEALVDNDLILIEDSEASNAQKKIKASNLPSGVSEETVLGYIIALS